MWLWLLSHFSSYLYLKVCIHGYICSFHSWSVCLMDRGKAQYYHLVLLYTPAQEIKSESLILQVFSYLICTVHLLLSVLFVCSGFCSCYPMWLYCVSSSTYYLNSQIMTWLLFLLYKEKWKQIEEDIHPVLPPNIMTCHWSEPDICARIFDPCILLKTFWKLKSVNFNFLLSLALASKLVLYTCKASTLPLNYILSPQVLVV